MMKIKPERMKKIYWGEITATTYQQGSTIQQLDKGRVLFKNRLMPSAQVIQSWSSQSVFGHTRRPPELPLLKRGQTYQLELMMTSTPAHTVLVEVVFLDRFGQTVDRTTSDKGQVLFTYPREAYSYEVHLLSAGLQELEFYYMTLAPYEGEMDED
ncbi:accessory Sec system protein Asp3 [Streptococcus sp. DD13]|uniref:accessory Sec system protein Asp3 n=1 Tax=Streptococcus sp. DD13 TaxID=1777881 RepID=UPI000794B40E|nr:accessory Sec system protein Asp3 [Streptococcus sp. DD13]KXT77737.1 Accessory secretory protein Asp3 [Streptococcus sp. DD13]